MGVEVHGTVAAGFEPVREAFETNFREQGEVGAACCVYVAGAPVVDLWGGCADPDSGRAWERDTLALVFSSTKGITAGCVMRLVEAGELELEAPVARYWPEFAANGKGAITLRQVLTHRAGLAAVEGDLSLEDVYAARPVCDAIARQAPHWEPGTAHGYHARSYGWILGEIVRRVTGRSLGTWFAEEVASRFGLDFYIGLPREHEERVATLVPAPEPTDEKAIALRERFMGPDTLLGRVLNGPSNLFSYGPMWNVPEIHAAEMPSSNGIGTAAALARFYATLAGSLDGESLLRPETRDRAIRCEVEGPDRVILMPTRFGLGFMLPPALCVACPEGAFGHPGAGGSLGFADPGRELAFGYAMNQMQLGLVGDPRAERLVEAVYSALDREC